MSSGQRRRAASSLVIALACAWSGAAFAADPARPHRKPTPGAATRAERATLDPAHNRANDWVDEGDGPNRLEQIEKIRSGDTLTQVLTRAGASLTDAQGAVAALKGVYNPRDLRPGREIRISLAPTGGGSYSLASATIQAGVERDVLLRRDGDGDGFSAKELQRPLSLSVDRRVGDISSSLYQAAVQAGAPVETVMEMIRAFSYDVDFQRDIRAGDDFDLVWEQTTTDRGDMARPARMLYAQLTLSGKRLSLYAYTPKGGATEYYNESGESIRKALLRTPLDGAKITSGFGMRMHPILGYSKMHKGVDFGAPAGTPIMASGDGVIAELGPNGAYGNYIQIKHTADFSTAYAHLSRFTAGLRKGSPVRQGQVIGLVGSTGRSTGPHLHYEVVKNGDQVDPQSVKFAGVRKLEGQQLREFEAVVRDLKRRLRETPGPEMVAEAPRKADETRRAR